MRILVGILAIWATLWASVAPGADIGVFSDPNCSSCQITIPVGETRTIYVSFVNDGTAPDVTGAELRLAGLPAAWTASWSANPAANIVLGDLLGAGVNIAFPAGQTAPCVTLFQVEVTATSPESEVELFPAAQVPPSNPNFACPLFRFSCICFPQFCVSGGTLQVNSSEDCVVGVRGTAWSAVKLLFVD